MHCNITMLNRAFTALTAQKFVIELCLISPAQPDQNWLQALTSARSNEKSVLLINKDSPSLGCHWEAVFPFRTDFVQLMSEMT